MKHLLKTFVIIVVFLFSCEGGGGGKDLNEDPTGNERGTPGTGTYDIGTGQEPHHVPGLGTDTERTIPPPGTPRDTTTPPVK